VFQCPPFFFDSAAADLVEVDSLAEGVEGATIDEGNNVLERHEMIEAIVRLAVAKKTHRQQHLSLSAQLEVFLNHKFLPKAHKIMANDFRRTHLYRFNIDMVFKQNKRTLQKIFEAYSTSVDEHHNLRLRVGDFISIVKDGSLLEDGVMLEDVNFAFVYSALTVLDELGSDKNQHLKFPDFLEALARLAYSVTNSSGWGDDEHDSDDEEMSQAPTNLPFEVKLGKFLAELIDEIDMNSSKLRGQLKDIKGGPGKGSSGMLQTQLSNPMFHKKDKFAHLAGGKTNLLLQRKQKSKRQIRLSQKGLGTKPERESNDDVGVGGDDGNAKAGASGGDDGIGGDDLQESPKRKRFVQRKSSVWGNDHFKNARIKQPLSARRPSLCSHDADETHKGRASLLMMAVEGGRNRNARNSIIRRKSSLQIQQVPGGHRGSVGLIGELLSDLSESSPKLRERSLAYTTTIMDDSDADSSDDDFFE
jgi:hypothetical protein